MFFPTQPKNPRLLSTTLTALTLVLFTTSLASAQQKNTPSSAPAQEASHALRLGFDVEIDPLAYAVKGHSLHVGIWLDQLRLDLGSFGLEIPEFAHGQKGFTSSFSGFGTKADWFFHRDRDGWFLGLEAGLARVTIARPQEQLAAQHLQISMGARAGYRWTLVDSFYVEPWIGVGYALGAKDVQLGQERFENNPLVIFPTIHIGYQIN